MFALAENLPEGLVVMLFTGTTNTDADWEGYIASFRDLDARAPLAGALPIVVQIIDPGNPVPNAAWRKRLAEASKDIRARPLCIVVTRSSLVRGAITAVNWLRPPPYELAWAEDFESAKALAERRRGTALPALTRLEAEVRRKARARP